MRDLTLLLATMHTYARPHGTATESAFIRHFIADLPNATCDDFDNWHVVIGDAPVIWSCHTDTVHRAEGRQHVKVQDGRLRLVRKSQSSCLGADDTVGVFLCREMILAGVAGHYMFHYGEEAGCIGSRSYADDHADDLAHYTHAIAFDRMGTADVITHQCGMRTCSDLFADYLADHLNVGGLHYSPSDRGLFTDTESYADIVSECSNVSVGYFGAHGRSEYVEVAHVLALRERLLALDPAALPVFRDPMVSDNVWGYHYGRGDSVVLDWPEEDDERWQIVDGVWVDTWKDDLPILTREHLAYADTVNDADFLDPCYGSIQRALRLVKYDKR